MTGMRPCGCGREGCDRRECIVCSLSDCKWPGQCRGKCRECGVGIATEPSGPIDATVPNPHIWCSDPSCSGPHSFCSIACHDVDDKRAMDAGLIVSLSDLTLEQTNQLLNTAGLAVEGVGPRQPS